MKFEIYLTKEEIEMIFQGHDEFFTGKCPSVYIRCPFNCHQESTMILRDFLNNDGDFKTLCGHHYRFKNGNMEIEK